MATTRDLKRRIRSVKNTQQITRAMKMVAAAKLRRAQEAATQAKPYAENVSRLVANLANTEGASANPFFDVRDEQNVELVLFSSDKGLCGGFNNNLIKRAHQLLNEELTGKKVEITALGRKVNEHFARRGFDIRRGEDRLVSKFTFADAEAIAQELIERFLEKEVDAVYCCYPEFFTALSQKPKVVRLLPFQPAKQESGGGGGRSYVFEPDAARVMERLLPRATVSLFYQFMLDTSAGEHGARMAAMENATNNAGDLIKSLTLQMNRMRQAAITTEIIEIVSGAEALG